MASTQAVATPTRARVTSRSLGLIGLDQAHHGGEGQRRAKGSTWTVFSSFRSQVPAFFAEPVTAIAGPHSQRNSLAAGSATPHDERRHHPQVQRVRPSAPGVAHRLHARPERGEVADAVHDVEHGLPRHPQAGEEHDREPTGPSRSPRPPCRWARPRRPPGRPRTGPLRPGRRPPGSRWAGWAGRCRRPPAEADHQGDGAQRQDRPWSAGPAAAWTAARGWRTAGAGSPSPGRWPG